MFCNCVGLDFLLGLSILRRCSLNRFCKGRFVSRLYCKLQRIAALALAPRKMTVSR